MNTYDANEPASPAGFHLGFVTAKFHETWDFYTELLGFRTLDEDDAYLLLVHPSGVKLEILRAETNERHAELVSETDGRGFWLNLEVDDVDTEYQRLCAGGVLLVHPPENQTSGRRAFTIRDPNGILVCISNRRAYEVGVCTCRSGWADF